MKDKKKGFLGRVLKMMVKDNPVRFVVIVLLCIFSSLGMVLGIGEIGDLFDVHIPAIAAATNEAELEVATKTFNNYIIKLAIFFSISVVTGFIQSILVVLMGQGLMKYIRHQTFEKMQYLPIKFFDTNKYGDIMSRYTNDTDTLDQFVTQTVPNFISSGLTLVMLLVQMLLNNWLLTIIVLVLLASIMFGMSGIMKRSAKHFINRQKLVGISNGYVEEMMQGARVVQVFNHQKKGVLEFKEINERFRIEDTKANTYGNIMFPMSANLIRLEFVIVALIGALYVMKSDVYKVGMLVTFLTLTNSFSNPIARMSQQVNSIAQAGAGARRIFEIIDATPETDDGYVTLVNATEDENGNIIETKENTHKWAWKHPHQADGTITYTPLKGDIVLDKVDFSYDQEKQILFDISIYANPGQRVALVGETGAGKTTITNLLNRFYDIEDGKIRYDGININKIKKNDLRRSLGLVLQDTNLFTGTIKDNIKLGKADATDEEVIAAAKLANADSFIRMMPDGYDTMLVRAGEQLSQGQRQLLAIARAAIADCPVLILDEATSSIDTRTEAIVQKGMDRLMSGRTTFVIAHRLSTIQNSDVIMVLDHGRIIERGNHEELIKKGGVYYSLYTGKFEFE
ncbi:MAG: ABC transporter ATP-binding protein/permease [Gammaproteobacteria bacterium]|nr:ABC transporter ATP-binding protein/permease [Gammaproteobacteria bacterium]